MTPDSCVTCHTLAVWQELLHENHDPSGTFCTQFLGTLVSLLFTNKTLYDTNLADSLPVTTEGEVVDCKVYSHFVYSCFIYSHFVYYFDRFSHFIYSHIPILSAEDVFTFIQPTQDHNGGINLYYTCIFYMENMVIGQSSQCRARSDSYLTPAFTLNEMFISLINNNE